MLAFLAYLIVAAVCIGAAWGGLALGLHMQDSPHRLVSLCGAVLGRGILVVSTVVLCAAVISAACWAFGYAF